MKLNYYVGHLRGSLFNNIFTTTVKVNKLHNEVENMRYIDTALRELYKEAQEQRTELHWTTHGKEIIPIVVVIEVDKIQLSTNLIPNIVENVENNEWWLDSNQQKGSVERARKKKEKQEKKSKINLKLLLP